jgi:RND superfamily putative drug exporter
MPSIKVVPAADSSRVGYNQVQAAFGEGATGPLEIVTRPRDADTVIRLARHDAGIAAVLPVQSTGALVTAIPRHDPSDPAVGQTIDRLRAQLPAGALIGGAVAENHELETALADKAPLVIGVVLGLGFLLLLVALQRR